MGNGNTPGFLRMLELVMASFDVEEHPAVRF
jgi:hypothetical protein